MFKQLIDKVLQAFLPSKMYLKLLIWKRGFEEPELKLVYDLCDKSLISVDIGAANGLYLAHLYSISKKCYAFEPRKTAIAKLKKMFSGVTDAIQFENVALSNFSGSADLRILKTNDRLSTIEHDNRIERFGDVDFVKVAVKKLDEYDFTGKVGFIKIDVEGHEEAVLQGALNLLKRDHPALLIEIEERHKKNSVSDIRELLSRQGYQGYFYMDGHLQAIELFDIEQYQDYGAKGKKYIFNFIYIHPEGSARIDHLIYRPSLAS